MKVFTHLRGSDHGYATLSCADGVHQEDRLALESIDLGLPDLNQPPLLYGAALPTGRYALTSCVPGQIDDARRQTISFPSIIFEAQDWVAQGRFCVPQWHGHPMWSSAAFIEGCQLTLNAVPGPRHPDGDIIAGAIMSGMKPIILASSPEARQAVLHAPGALTPALASVVVWGVSLQRIPENITVVSSAPHVIRSGVRIQSLLEFKMSQCKQPEIDIPAHEARLLEVEEFPDHGGRWLIAWMLAIGAGAIFVIIMLLRMAM